MSLNLDKSTWKRVAFGDVVRNVNESVRDPEAASIDRVIAMEHVDPGELKINRWGSIEDGTTFTRRVKPGQTLFGKRRAYQRKVAYAEFEAICSGDILTFDADPEQLLPEFLPFLVQSDGFFDHALGTSAGSLSPRTNWRDLSNYEFDLPPLDEQKRYVDLLWAIEMHGRSLHDRHKALVRVETELLRESFPQEWPRSTVGELGEIQLGQRRTPGSSTGPKVRPYLRVANVGDNKLLLDDVYEMDFSTRGAERLQLRDRDVLLNEGQSLELVGRCAMFRGEVDDCYFQSSLLRFRGGPDVTQEFALAWFRHCVVTGKFSAVASKTTSVAHLTAEKLARVGMPHPGLDMQARVVANLDRVGEALALARGDVEALRESRRALIDEMFGGN